MNLFGAILAALAQGCLSLSTQTLEKFYASEEVYENNYQPFDAPITGIDMCSYSFHKHIIEHGNSSNWVGFYLDQNHTCNILTKIPSFVLKKSSSYKVAIYFDQPALFKMNAAVQPAIKLEFFGFAYDADDKRLHEMELVNISSGNFALPTPSTSPINNLTKFQDGDFSFATVWGGNSYFCLAVQNTCYFKPLGSGVEMFQEFPIDGALISPESSVTFIRQGEIWFIGGTEGTNNPNQFKKFINGKFSDGPTSLPGSGLKQHAAVLLGSKLIIATGMNGGSPDTFNRNTYIYDFDTSDWTTLTNNWPIDLIGAGMAVWTKSEEEQVPIVFGGYNYAANNRDTYSFNFTTGQWNTEIDLKMHHIHATFNYPIVHMVNGVVFSIACDKGMLGNNLYMRYYAFYLKKFGNEWMILRTTGKYGGGDRSPPFLAYSLESPLKYIHSQP